MEPLASLSLVLEAVQTARDVSHWARERKRGRKLEVVILTDPSPVLTVRDIRPRSHLRWVNAHFRLRLANHRTDRAERVIGCRLALKLRHLWFWRRTVVEVPVLTLEGKRLDVLLEPLSSPTEIELHTPNAAEIPAGLNDADLVLVLVLEMVGPTRTLERALGKVK